MAGRKLQAIIQSRLMANNRDSAWYYPEPSDAAKEIKGYIWRGVEIVEN